MMRRSSAPLALLGVVALLVVGIDALAGPAPDRTPAATEPVVSEPRAGEVVCAVGLGGPGEPPVGLPEISPPQPDDEEAAEPEDDAENEPEDDAETEGEQGADEDAPPGPEPAELVVARPGAAGGAPAQLERLDLLPAGAELASLPSVFPGGAVRTRGPIDDAPAASVVRWRDGAVAVQREWLLDGLEGYPPARVSGGCARASGGLHIVPGLSTEGGDEARIRLVNPYLSPASAAVRFAAPGDPEAPLALRNISVPPRSVREVIINDTLPERSDLAALVEVTSGRLAVEGLLVSRAAIGGIDGASLLAASTQPAEDWTVPWVVDDDDHASWLWIVNLGERTATVELTLHTSEGGELPVGLSSVSVPEGELRRVDLTGTLPEGQDEVAVSARSNGVPIVVSGGVVRVDDDEERTGVAVQLGAAGAGRWVVSGRAAEDRRESLVLSNPEGERAVVDVTLFAGVQPIVADELRQLEIPAGGRRVVELDEVLPPTGGWTAFVTAREGVVVAGRVGWVDDDRPLELVATPAIPETSWLEVSTALRPVARPGLVAQLGTAGSRAGTEVPAGLLRPEDADAEPTEDGVGE